VPPKPDLVAASVGCFEIGAGILANSTALLADSLDMLADPAIYGIALYAVGKPDSFPPSESRWSARANAAY
jgi:Co/Zn/Cd efflux system component